MRKTLMKMILLRLKRNRKVTVRTFVTAVMAVFFVTAVLLFQDNLYEWQMASNKERFGDWFMVEANTRTQNEYLKNHPLLRDNATALSAVKLYNKEYVDTKSYIGYVSDDFIRIGRINLVEGRMPSSDDEIVMDRNTLAKNNYYDAKVGDELTLYYYKGNNSGKGNEKYQYSEKFKLVGILEDYSNVWMDSRYFPGALVTESKYESYGVNALTTHIYKLDDSARHKDYKIIYEEIKSQININPSINKYVYEFEAWKSDKIYNYIYMLIMVIGTVTLTYQLLFFRNSRKMSNGILKKLGATNGQIALATLVEHIAILLPAGLLGIVLAVVVGAVVCFIISVNLGMEFYYVSLSLILKGLFAILVAVVVAQIASVGCEAGALLRSGRRKKAGKAGAKVKRYRKVGKCRLNRHNIYRELSFRFTRANKFTQNIGVRLLSLSICAVILFCCNSIYDKYKLYDFHKDDIDISGILCYEIQSLSEYELDIPYILDITDMLENSESVTKELMDIRSGLGTPYKYQVPYTKELAEAFASIDEHNNSITVGNTRIFCFDMTFLEKDDRLYAGYYLPLGRGQYYRTPNTNVGIGIDSNMIKTIESVPGVENVRFSSYENQRPWTWENMSVEKMGYERLIIDRNEFVAKGTYGYRSVFGTEYVSPSEEMYQRLCKYIEPQYQNYEEWATGEQVVVFIRENPMGVYDDTLKAGDMINYHDTQLRKIANTQAGDKSDYHNAWKSLNRMYDYSLQTKAAAVVRLTEEIERDLNDILCYENQYTSIASDALIKKATEAYSDGEASDVSDSILYNRITINYNIMSSICSTDNIVSTYFKENSIEYKSNYDSKEKYRTDLINAFLLYGVTIISVIVINVFVCAVIARNRLEARRGRIEQLKNMGSTKGSLLKVFMIESVRESVWCIFTMPVIVLWQYIIYRKGI